MAQRIVLSREQVRKLRQLRGEGDDSGAQDTDAEVKTQPFEQRSIDEGTRPYEVLTQASITNRIRRPWGFER